MTTPNAMIVPKVSVDATVPTISGVALLAIFETIQHLHSAAISIEYFDLQCLNQTERKYIHNSLKALLKL